MNKPVEPKKDVVKTEAPAAVEAPKAAPAVKAEPAAKRTAAKKPAAKKAPAKKAAAEEKAPAKKPATRGRKSGEFIVQFNGKDWNVDEIKAKVAAEVGRTTKSVSIYVNVVEGVAYYVVGGKEGGSVAL